MSREIPDELVRRILYKQKGFYWFFNEKGFLSVISEYDDPDKYDLWSIRDDGGRYSDGETQRAINRMHIGDSYEKYRELVLSERVYDSRMTTVEQFICKIHRPIFIEEEKRPNVLNFVHVDVSILSQEAMKDREQFLKKHLNEMITIVMKKIQSYHSYRRFSLSDHALKLAQASLHRKQDILELVFKVEQFNVKEEMIS